MFYDGGSFPRSRNSRWRLLCISALVFSLWLFSSGCSSAESSEYADNRRISGQSSRIPDTYDASFRRHSARWLPQWDYRWLKAQCWQESSFRPTVVSPAGARGLCQFMPKTWAEVTAQLGMRASPNNPRASIRAAAFYMHRLRRQWIWERPEWDRRQLAQASYNAGLGSILAAQRECGSPRSWFEIRECLPEITGRHAAETVQYVERIEVFACGLIAEDW